MGTTSVLIVLKYYLILFSSSTLQKMKPRPSQAGVSEDTNNGLLSLVIILIQKKSQTCKNWDLKQTIRLQD